MGAAQPASSVIKRRQGRSFSGRHPTIAETWIRIATVKPMVRRVAAETPFQKGLTRRDGVVGPAYAI